MAQARSSEASGCAKLIGKAVGTVNKMCKREFWLEPPRPHVGCISCIMWFVSVVLHCVMFGWNVWSLYSYASIEDWTYFSVLLAAMVLPQIPINLFSYWWYRTDTDGLVSWPITIAHCLLQGLGLRMVSITRHLKHAWSSHEGSDFHRYYLAQADLSFLRLVNVYTGSAPQLVVRIYRLIDQWQSGNGETTELVFACLTAGSLALATISYGRASRCHRFDKQELSYASVMLQVTYRTCFLAARVFALACLFHLGFVCGLVTCIFLCGIFFTWFRCMTTNFTASPKQEMFYHCLLSVWHLFGMLNVKDTDARYRYAFYYSLSLIGEVYVVTIFMKNGLGGYWPILFLPAFFTGLICHGLEHSLFHPGGTLYIPRREEDWEHACAECEEAMTLRKATREESYAAGA